MGSVLSSGQNKLTPFLGHAHPPNILWSSDPSLKLEILRRVQKGAVKKIQRMGYLQGWINQTRPQSEKDITKEKKK